MELAQNLVGAEGLNQAAHVVIAEVALAEHQHLYGRDAYRDAHLAAAAAAADSGFEASPDNLQEWAIAYIARGEAKFGLFAKAHGSLRRISDEQIKDSAMIDISNYAASEDNEPTFEIRDATNGDISVDDRELILLLDSFR